MFCAWEKFYFFETVFFAWENYLLWESISGHVAQLHWTSAIGMTVMIKLFYIGLGWGGGWGWLVGWYSQVSWQACGHMWRRPHNLLLLLLATSSGAQTRKCPGGRSLSGRHTPNLPPAPTTCSVADWSPGKFDHLVPEFGKNEFVTKYLWNHNLLCPIQWKREDCAFKLWGRGDWSKSWGNMTLNCKKLWLYCEQCKK